MSLSKGTTVSPLISHTDSAPDCAAAVLDRKGVVGVAPTQVVRRPVRVGAMVGLALVVWLRLRLRYSKFDASETGPAQSLKADPEMVADTSSVLLATRQVVS